MTRKSDGFTLIEMLVALALLSMLTAYAFMAISGMSRAKEIETRIAERSDLGALERHLRQTIGDMRSVFAGEVDGAARLAFAGRADSVEFVAPINDQIARGGLYSVRYSAPEDRGGFVMGYDVFRPNARSTGYATVEMLMAGAKGVRFRYFGDAQDGTPAAWRDTWLDITALPSAVEVSLTLNNNAQVAYVFRRGG